MPKQILSFLLLLLASSGFQSFAFTVSPLFGDHMVLQRNKPIIIWGKGKPGEKVTAIFAGIQSKSKTGPDSIWKCLLFPHKEGGPYSIILTGKNEIVLNDVWFGEVWIASGQSNMEMKLKQQVTNNALEISMANYPMIRAIDIQNQASAIPVNTIKTTGWDICSPQSAGDISAVAYFFAREIHQKLNVPIGLIQCDWGGTPAEAWTSKEALSEFPEFNRAIASLTDPERDIPVSANFPKALAAFRESVKKHDAGTIGQWWKAELPGTETDWKTMEIPNGWENAGLDGFDGIVWFRKEFTVSKQMAEEKGVVLHLSTIDDLDSTWLNGVKIGGIKGHNIKREYVIPDGLLKEGKNVVSVQVLDWVGGGGLWGPKDEIRIQGKSGSIPLAGDWKYKVGCDYIDLKPIADDLDRQNKPTTLYNGMLHPLITLSIAGAIWYQGEANAGRPYQYRTLFPAMIKDWRAKFDIGDFPFYFVQLSNFKKPDPSPKESNWAELREAQTMALSLPNTGMACIIDAGEAGDIHPANKQAVGYRLALQALSKTYNRNVACESPRFEKAISEGNTLRISFEFTYNGLKVTDPNGIVKGFAVAGADKKYHWAQAKLDGSEVLVSSPDVQQPVYVRYAWANNPADVNVFNSADLPLIPFRTDK
ncbi:MAG TPA: sialate O-acetylesterase [Catalimonadaceae bacterium]|nr:sialate O-acetylesterase [Catalimonadaceae bacterium]